MSTDDFRELQSRFTRNALYRGPCLIIDRQTGLALDATPDAESGTRPILWHPHAGPWQQWRLQASGRGLVRIMNEHSQTFLTTDEPPGNGSWVWLDKHRQSKLQEWRLKPTEERAALVVETKGASFGLDSGRAGEAEVGDPPILWDTQPEVAWQQWIICRLPIS